MGDNKMYEQEVSLVILPLKRLRITPYLNYKKFDVYNFLGLPDHGPWVDYFMDGDFDKNKAILRNFFLEIYYDLKNEHATRAPLVNTYAYENLRPSKTKLRY